MIITVSIVSFNTCELLKNTLENIYKQKTSHQIEVWVVDNASEDGSAEMVKKEFSQAHLLENKKNLGFGRAHNQVFAKTKSSDMVLLLNPDTKLPDDALEKMAKFMEKYPECGIASCKLVGFDGKLQSNGGDLPFGIALLSWLFNLDFFHLPNFHRTEEKYYREVHTVGWVGGTFMMLRTKVLEKIGYFNEDFFMYFEDCELCFRAKEQGFKIMVNPDITVEHKSGASSLDPNLKQWTGEFKGLVYFYNKLFGSVGGFLVKLLIYKAIILRIVAFTLLGKRHIAKTYGKILFNI